jgi:hypothetical protein
VNVFLQGGRIGDTIYALYVVKKLGGGIFQQCLRHAPHRWDEVALRDTLKLVAYQPYVKEARFVKVPAAYMMPDTPKEARHLGEDPIEWTHNFIDSESQNDPQNYPDLCYVNYLHYAHQARRHCVYFGVKWDPDDVWISAPKTKTLDIAFHAPSYRLVRELQKTCRVVILSGRHDKYEWDGCGEVVVANTILEAADWVNSAHCFLGAASCCYAIAEGMKQFRFIELATDCFNNYPYGPTGRLINHWSNREVIGHVREFIEERRSR